MVYLRILICLPTPNSYEMKVATPIISKKMMEEQKGQKRRQIYRWPGKHCTASSSPVTEERWAVLELGSLGVCCCTELLLGGLLHKTSSPSLETQAGIKSLLLY